MFDHSIWLRVELVEYNFNIMDQVKQSDNLPYKFQGDSQTTLLTGVIRVCRNIVICSLFSWSMVIESTCMSCCVIMPRSKRVWEVQTCSSNVYWWILRHKYEIYLKIKIVNFTMDTIIVVNLLLSFIWWTSLKLFSLYTKVRWKKMLSSINFAYAQFF